MRIASILLLAFICGCAQYKGAKVVEGTDLAVGMTIPVENAPLKLEAINWLSGFRLGVDQNSIMSLEYSVSETNSYFGVISTTQNKKVIATVEPCEAIEDDEVEQH